MFGLDDHQRRTSPALFDARAGSWLTYAQLEGSIRRVAAELTEPPRGLAFAFCRNSVPSIVGYLSLLESEHAAGLLDDALDADTRRALIERYRPELVLDGATHDYQDLGYELRGSPIGGLAVWSSGTHAGPLDPRLELLLTTSGTTGSPKLVRLSAANLASNTRSICQALAIAPEDRAVTTLPVFYTYGLSVVNTHLAAGASVVVTEDGVVAPGLWDLVRETECTSLAGVPYTYLMLERVGFESLELPSLRTLTQAGGRLAPEAVARFGALMAGRGGRLHVMYGQTEATARISVLPPADLPAKAGSVGLAIPGGSLAIEIDGVRTTESGVTGEVVFEGPNVMMGYATERAHLARGDELGGILHTGDLGSFDDDGYLWLSGRNSRIAKVFGLRLNLDEVEARVAHHGPTAALQRGEHIVLFCAWGDRARLDEHRRELARGLRINHRSIEMVRLDALPHTPSGKVDYRSLERAQTSDRLDDRAGFRRTMGRAAGGALGRPDEE